MFEVERSKFDVFPLKMPPRPLHRWKSFWLGLLVLIFLGWAWVRSMHQTDDISYKPSSSSISWGASIQRGTVLLAWLDDPSVPDGLNVSSFSGWKTKIWFKKAIVLQGARTGGWQSMHIAHWFLILLFLVPWAGFLIWRVRRMRRVGENPTSVEN
jgi:hypothetical protein